MNVHRISVGATFWLAQNMQQDELPAILSHIDRMGYEIGDPDVFLLTDLSSDVPADRTLQVDAAMVEDQDSALYSMVTMVPRPILQVQGYGRNILEACAFLLTRLIGSSYCTLVDVGVSLLNITSPQHLPPFSRDKLLMLQSIQSNGHLESRGITDLRRLTSLAISCMSDIGILTASGVEDIQDAPARSACDVVPTSKVGRYVLVSASLLTPHIVDLNTLQQEGGKKVQRLANFFLL